VRTAQGTRKKYTVMGGGNVANATGHYKNNTLVRKKPPLKMMSSNIPRPNKFSTAKPKQIGSLTS